MSQTPLKKRKEKSNLMKSHHSTWRYKASRRTWQIKRQGWKWITSRWRCARLSRKQRIRKVLMHRVARRFIYTSTDWYQTLKTTCWTDNIIRFQWWTKPIWFKHPMLWSTSLNLIHRNVKTFIIANHKPLSIARLKLAGMRLSSLTQQSTINSLAKGRKHATLEVAYEYQDNASIQSKMKTWVWAALKLRTNTWKTDWCCKEWKSIMHEKIIK